MLTNIFSVFSYGFMVRALVAGLVTAVIAPLIGTFVVVRRFSMLADTLSHIALLGVVIGIVMGSNVLVFALITSLLAAVGIEHLREDRSIGGESVLALFLSGSLAMALVLLSWGKGSNASLTTYLFGSITTVTTGDMAIITILGAVVLATIWLLYKEFFALSFDEEVAQSQGMPVRLYGTILTLLAAITVTVSLRIVGALLIGALMVIPVLTAIQFRQGFARTIGIAIAVSVLSVFSGLVISYGANTSSGGTIVCIAFLIFLIARWFFSRTSERAA